MIPSTDIDIDVADRKKVLKLFKHTIAAIERDDTVVAHNTGVYFHKVPTNPISGLCNIDHKVAEEMGYFKIDILNLSIYNNVKDPDHLNHLVNTEPLWDLLQHPEFTEMLFHVRGNSEVMVKLKPQSVLELAACLAIIRPAKRYLVNKSWDTIMKEVWIKPNDGSYYFKKSHSISYAMVVIVHMNLLCEQLM